MKIIDLADQTFRELGEPSDLSVAYLTSWFKFDSNIGQLNNLLHTTYSVVSNELVDSNNEEIGSEEASIYKLIFNISYYARQARNSLGVGGVDILVEATSDGGTLRFANRNDISKNWNSMRKDAETSLNKLINFYKFNKYSPQQVEGDDTNVNITTSRIPNNGIVNDSNIFRI